MTKAEKILDRMKNNPQSDWSIDDLKTVAKRFGVEYRQPGTSHVTFRAPNGEKVTVPAHKTSKPVYVRAFLAMIVNLEE
ncbi:MAG: type II toxin-antitoxin system HicA family toxin [Thermodesulfobacteriota bacterium]